MTVRRTVRMASALLAFGTALPVRAQEGGGQGGGEQDKYIQTEQLLQARLRSAFRNNQGSTTAAGGLDIPNLSARSTSDGSLTRKDCALDSQGGEGDCPILGGLKRKGTNYIASAPRGGIIDAVASEKNMDMLSDLYDKPVFNYTATTSFIDNGAGGAQHFSMLFGQNQTSNTLQADESFLKRTREGGPDAAEINRSYQECIYKKVKEKNYTPQDAISVCMYDRTVTNKDATNGLNDPDVDLVSDREHGFHYSDNPNSLQSNQEGGEGGEAPGGGQNWADDLTLSDVLFNRESNVDGNNGEGTTGEDAQEQFRDIQLIADNVRKYRNDFTSVFGDMKLVLEPDFSNGNVKGVWNRTYEVIPVYYDDPFPPDPGDLAGQKRLTGVEWVKERRTVQLLAHLLRIMHAHCNWYNENKPDPTTYDPMADWGPIGNEGFWAMIRDTNNQPMMNAAAELTFPGLTQFDRIMEEAFFFVFVRAQEGFDVKQAAGITYDCSTLDPAGAGALYRRTKADVYQDDLPQYLRVYTYFAKVRAHSYMYELADVTMEMVSKLSGAQDPDVLDRARSLVYRLLNQQDNQKLQQDVAKLDEVIKKIKAWAAEAKSPGKGAMVPGEGKSGRGMSGVISN